MQVLITSRYIPQYYFDEIRGIAQASKFFDWTIMKMIINNILFLSWTVLWRSPSLHDVPWTYQRYTFIIIRLLCVYLLIINCYLLLLLIIIINYYYSCMQYCGSMGWGNSKWRIGSLESSWLGHCQSFRTSLLINN